MGTIELLGDGMSREIPVKGLEGTIRVEQTDEETRITVAEDVVVERVDGSTSTNDGPLTDLARSHRNG